ncbi:hypothetical protein Tco_0372993, partial [Tanacetum coccineum]
LLRGGSSDSGRSSLRSTGGGMYRDGGRGGNGGDDDGSNGNGTGCGDECADGVVHLARRSPAEGGWYETDIREKDEKSSKNKQNRARNGKAWKPRKSTVKAEVKSE